MRSLVLLGWLLLSVLPGRAATWEVIVGDYFFSPTNLTIAPGDTVTWINLGFHPHDTTASDGSWASPLLFAEESFTLAPGDPSYPFNDAREFPYICLTHLQDYPWQSGLIVVASANLPPAVQITSPANGDSFVAPANLTVTAGASDPDGTITSVQFFRNGSPIGTSTGPTFSANVASLGAGTHSFTAIATDNQGATANATAVIVTVTNPPVVEKFPLTTAVSPPGSGSITLNPPQPVDGYSAGTVVTLTAGANEGFAFSNWSGTVGSTDNPLSLTITAATSVTANFVPVAAPTYALSLNVSPAGAGTIQANPAPNAGGGKYVQGTVVTLTATPAANFAFTNFTGDITSTSNTATVTMTSDRSVTANFVEGERRFTLTAQAAPSNLGIIVIDPPPLLGGAYAPGTSVTLRAEPNAQSRFVRWTGSVTSSEPALALVMDTNKSVTAHFELVPTAYRLVLATNPPDGGVILVSQPPRADGTYTGGMVIAVAALPNAGFRFSHWGASPTLGSTNNPLIVQGNPTQLTPTQTVSLVANFVPLPPLNFALLNGTWTGLLIDEAETNYTTTGLISLRVSKAGAYRGHATIGGMRSSVAGQFDQFGYAPLVVRRATLDGWLQISEDALRVTGSLTDGRQTATLLLYREMSLTNAELFAGQYQLVVEAASPVLAGGAASMQILPNGTVRIRGTLGDGTSWSEKTFVTADGRVPVFSPLYGRRGVFAGWLEVSHGIANGTARWFRPADSRSLNYPAGFSLVVPVFGPHPH